MTDVQKKIAEMPGYCMYSACDSEFETGEEIWCFEDGSGLDVRFCCEDHARAELAKGRPALGWKRHYDDMAKDGSEYP